MHEALWERPSIQPPILIATCSVPDYGQTTAGASSSGCDEAPETQTSPLPESYTEESMPSTSSQPPTKRPKRGEGMLFFLNKQAEKEELRDAALQEPNKCFLTLFAELVKKTTI